MPESFVKVEGLDPAKPETWEKTFRDFYGKVSAPTDESKKRQKDTYATILTDLLRTASLLEKAQLGIFATFMQKVLGEHSQSTGVFAFHWGVAYLGVEVPMWINALSQLKRRDDLVSIADIVQGSYQELRLPYVRKDGCIASLLLQYRPPLSMQLEDETHVYLPGMCAISLMSYPPNPSADDEEFYSFNDVKFHLFLDSETWENTKKKEGDSDHPDVSIQAMSKDQMLKTFNATQVLPGNAEEQDSLQAPETLNGILGHPEANRLLCFLIRHPQYINTLSAQLRNRAGDEPLPTPVAANEDAASAVVNYIPVCSAEMLRTLLDDCENEVNKQKEVDDQKHEKAEETIKKPNGRWQIGDIEAIDLRELIKQENEKQERKEQQAKAERERRRLMRLVRRFSKGGIVLFTLMFVAAIGVTRGLEFISIFSGLLGATMGAGLAAALLISIYGSKREKVIVLALPILTLAGFVVTSTSIAEMFQAIGVAELTTFSPLVIGLVSGALFALIAGVVYICKHRENSTVPDSVPASSPPAVPNIYQPGFLPGPTQADISAACTFDSAHASSAVPAASFAFSGAGSTGAAFASGTTLPAQEVLSV